jgi:hypothetical protein
MASELEEEASLKCPYGRLLEILGKPRTLAILHGFGVDSPLRFTQATEKLGPATKGPQCAVARAGQLRAPDSQGLQRDTSAGRLRADPEGETWKGCSRNCKSGPRSSESLSPQEKRRKDIERVRGLESDVLTGSVRLLPLRKATSLA